MQMTFLKVEKKSTTWLTQKSWYWWELPITDRKCHFCLMFIIYLLTGGQEWLLDTLMSTWGGSDLARDQPGKTLQPFIMNQSSNLKQEPMVDRSELCSQTNNNTNNGHRSIYEWVEHGQCQCQCHINRQCRVMSCHSIYSNKGYV